MCCCLNGCVTLSNIVRRKGCQITTFYLFILMRYVFVIIMRYVFTIIIMSLLRYVFVIIIMRYVFFILMHSCSTIQSNKKKSIA